MYPTKLTGRKLAILLSDMLPGEDCSVLAKMEISEAIDYAIRLLNENGLADPESYLKNLGIIKN